jgi:hypothetical protein
MPAKQSKEKFIFEFVSQPTYIQNLLLVYKVKNMFIGQIDSLMLSIFIRIDIKVILVSFWLRILRGIC